MLRYRLNRKDALVYRDYGENQIEPIGHTLDAVILWASPTFTDSLFGIPSQQWVQLAVLVRQESGLEIAYFVLNSGNTGALYNWDNYLKSMDEKQRSLSSVITRFGFEEADVYFDYTFQPFDAPKTVARAQQWIKDNPRASMVDESLPPNTVVKLKKMYRAQNPELVKKKVGLIF